VKSENGSELLSAAFTLSSVGNALGGAMLLILVATGVTAYPGHNFPVIAIAVGCVLLVQGLYSAGYVQGWWRISREVARGALLSGPLISACAAIATLVYAVYYNPRADNGGIEPAPFFAGALMAVNALLAFVLVATSRVATQQPRAREST
jgi:hypothetical protein